MPCACLPENRQVAGNGEIACHSDFLAAGDSHAVHSADNRFFAVQDSIHHAVEQIHVFPVLLGPHGIVFGIFFGVSAGAEGHVARPGENDGHNGTVLAGCRESRYHTLDHFSRVGIVLLGIIEANPGDVEPVNCFAVRRCQRFLFVDRARSLGSPMLGTHKDVIFAAVVSR